MDTNSHLAAILSGWRLYKACLYAMEWLEIIQVWISFYEVEHVGAIMPEVHTFFFIWLVSMLIFLYSPVLITAVSFFFGLGFCMFYYKSPSKRPVYSRLWGVVAFSGIVVEYLLVFIAIWAFVFGRMFRQVGSFLEFVTDTVSWTAPYVPSYRMGEFCLSIKFDLLSSVFFLFTILLFSAVLLFYKDIMNDLRILGFFFLLKTACFLAFFSADLITFIIASECALIPMWLMFSLNFNENRDFAAVYYVAYSTLGGIISLLGTLWLYSQGVSILFSGVARSLFEQGAGITGIAAVIVGLLIKMPCAPFHHWLLVAHVEASTSGSILLAGILLKLPAYAVLRIFHAFGAAVPQTLQGCILAFTLLSVFLCCFKIWGELDLKRIIAISSIVHMNVAIGSLGWVHSGGIYTVIPSVIIILLAHSFSSGVLFAFAGMLSSRYHTRDICEMRGLFKSAPRFTLHFLIISFLSGALPIGLTFSSELVFFSQLIRGAYTLLIVFYLLGLFIVFIKLLITFVDISSGEKPRSVIIVDLTRSEFLLSTVFICILGILFIYSSYLFSFIALSIKSAVINKKISDIHFANVFDIKKWRLKRGDRFSRKNKKPYVRDLQVFEGDRPDQIEMDLAVADRIIKRGLELRNVPGFGAESTIDAKKIDLSSPIASPFMGPKDIPKANVKIKVVDRDNFNGGNT